MVPGWYRRFIAISGAVVGHVAGDGIAPDPLFWSAGALPKRRRLVQVFLPGPAGIRDGEWITLAAAPVTAEDVGAWPFSVGMLVKLVAFLRALHWLAAEDDLGVGGVSFVEVLILYELCAGERLVLEKAVSRHLRPGRPISVSAVPIGPGTDFWRSCRFIQALFRASRTMPGGIGRFIPCDVGANHCRLRHIVWEKCGHGLTSRPRESASEVFLDELLVLFRYPPRSAAALLESIPPDWYCAGRSACGTPTWRLPVDGHVSGLVTEEGGRAGFVQDEHSALVVMPGFRGDDGVDWIGGSGGGVKRVRLNRKTPAHLVGPVIRWIQSRPRVWKRLRVWEHPGSDLADAKARRVHQSGEQYAPVIDREGIG